MDFTALPPLDYESIPYAQASPALQQQALHQLQGLFEERFPTFSAAQWQEALRRCYPVLEVGGGTIEFREEDLTRLATYWSLKCPTVHSAAPPAYCKASYHVAHKLLGFSRYAASALAQADALSPKQRKEALQLYRSALENITGGDAVAIHIKRAFAFKAWEGVRIHRVYQHPFSPTENLSLADDIPTPPLSRGVQEMPEQWYHLQQWFKRNNDPTRPWNVSSIARQLKVNQSVMRAWLTAPKGAAGVSRTAFTRERLRQLQRYFERYGYVPIG